MKINNLSRLILFSIIVLTVAACGTAKKPISLGNYAKESVDAQNRKSLAVKSTFHDALAAKMMDDNKEAVQLFKKVLKEDPKNHAAMFELARIYFEDGNLLEADNYIGQAIKLDKSNKWYQLLQAEILAYQSKFDQAARIYEDLLSVHQLDPELYFELAFLYERDRNFSEAIKTYDRLEKMIGLEEEIVLQKEKLYLKLNDFESAAGEVEKLIARYPDNSKYYGMLAEIHESAGNRSKALDTYQKLLKVDPGNPFAAFSLANFYKNEGDNERFREYAGKAFRSPELSIDMKVGFLFNYLSKLENEAEREEAFWLAEMIIEAHPEEAKAYAMYADLLNNSGSHNKALEQYLKALEYENSIFTVWEQTMLLQAQQKKFKELKETSQGAIELFPSQAIPYFFNGIAKNQLKEHEGAVRMLDRALIIGGSDDALKAEIYSRLGDAYHAMEEHIKSDEHYEKSLAINPNNAFVLNNYSYYLSLRKQNLDKAAEMARKANELSKNNTAFQDTYAWVLYQQGNYQEAETWIKKALESGGNQQPEILDHYGDILFKLGKTNEAVEYWQKALNKGGDREILQRKINERKLYE